MKVEINTLKNNNNYYYKYFYEIENILISLGKKMRRRMQQVNEIFLRTLETHLGVFRQILQTVLNIIIFEECRNQWSMSRPLLGLILLNEEVLIVYTIIINR